MDDAAITAGAAGDCDDGFAFTFYPDIPFGVPKSPPTASTAQSLSALITFIY